MCCLSAGRPHGASDMADNFQLNKSSKNRKKKNVLYADAACVPPPTFLLVPSSTDARKKKKDKKQKTHVVPADSPKSERSSGFQVIYELV